MENFEIYMLIVIAILEVVDGQGIALRILRLLSSLIGGDSNGNKRQYVQVIQNQEVGKKET